VIDVTKLARQDQPLSAYQNVDEPLPNNASRLTARASRPLLMPRLDRHNSSSSIHSPNPTTVTDTVDTYVSTDLPPQSPSFANSLNTSSSFSPTNNSSQPIVGTLERLHSHNSSPTQDLIERSSASIIPLLTTTAPCNVLASRNASSESNLQSAPSDSFNQFAWVQNQSPSSAQQATLAPPAFSSRPISSPGLIQTHTLPTSHSPPAASSSRDVPRPFSEHAADMGCTRHPPPAAPASASRLPPPAPPTILDPPPVRSNSARSFRAPHEPFLSDAPPPPDSWIAVETLQAEYRLNARLPGFRRDAMYVTSFVTSTHSLTDDMTSLKNSSSKAAEGVARCG
jgi:hypothetical protein